MSPKPVFAGKGPSRKAQEMRQASQGVLAEGQLHRASVQESDQAGGYQPPAEAPQPDFRGAGQPHPPPLAEEIPLIPEPEEDPNEPPALVFDLPTRRRRGKVSDDNYRGTSLRIHNQLWKWAREVKLNDGWDLADLVNLGLAKLKAEWERGESDISSDS